MNALKIYKSNARNPSPTCLKAAPPRDTKFAIYQWDSEKESPCRPFVRQQLMPWQTVPLYQAQVAELLACGETPVSIAERPEDRNGQPGRYIFIEPMEQALIVNLGMVGITGSELQQLVNQLLLADLEVGKGKHMKRWNIKELTQGVVEEAICKPCWSMGEALAYLSGIALEGHNTIEFPPNIGVGKDADWFNRAAIAGKLVPVGHDKNGKPPIHQ